MAKKYCEPGMQNFGLFLRSLAILALFLLVAVWSGGGLRAQTDGAPDDAGLHSATPGACGEQPLSIARMQWPSSILLAYVHALILQNELGCSVQVVPGDLAASTSSMATTGQPAIVPELWVTRVAPIWNATLESGRVRPVGNTFSTSVLEGWYLPAHVATAEPDLNEAGQLLDYATRLAEEGERPIFISCPPDWACALINRNLLEAYGLQDLFELIEPANRFEMDRLIALSVSRRQPAVYYYWQPNSVLAQFDFKALDMGAFDKEKFSCLARISCRTPQISSFVPENVFIVVSDWVTQSAPLAVRYLQRARMPIDEMDRLLADQAEKGGSFEDAAARFVEERPEVWQPWLGGS